MPKFLQKITRRAVVGGIGATSASPAMARLLRPAGGVLTGPPSITNVLIGGQGNGSTIFYQAATPNAAIGAITSLTSDLSNPGIVVTDTDSAGFHPLTGTANSMTLLAPSGGVTAGVSHNVTITASGAYANSPQAITVTLTASTTVFQVNGSTTSASVISLDFIGITATAVPGGDGVIAKLQDTTNTTTYTQLDFGNPSATNTGGQMLLNMVNGFSDPIPLTAGPYHVNFFLHSAPSTIVSTIALTVAAYKNPPFWNYHGSDSPTGSLASVLVVDAAAGGAVHAPRIVGPDRPQGTVVSGNITTAIAWNASAASVVPVDNWTAQYFLVDKNLTYHSMGAPVFNGGIASFDTTTLPNGSYLLTAKIIDINDTAHGWVACQADHLAQPVIICNPFPGGSMDITVNQKIPVSYFNFRNFSGGIDSLNYAGVSVSTPSQGAAAHPYPALNVLPVYNSSSPYFSNPVSAVTAPMWFESVQGHWNDEYKNSIEWRTTNAGGIWAQPFYGKTVAGNSIEGSYPTVARGSYRDGTRNCNFTTSFVSFAAMPQSGPWSAYHWTIIQEDGRLAALSLTGTLLTIGGPTRDLTILPIDFTDKGNDEFPNTVLRGGIDPLATYTFSDFGGGSADCCWDPRDPYICYVPQTIDHCIIKYNWHTQTYNGVNYGATAGPGGTPFPLCQRYAGYKAGLYGQGTGGYAEGPALGTFTGTFTGTISGTTLTVSGLTGTLTAGQVLTDLGGGNLAFGTMLVSGGPVTWTISPSQTVASETMYANNGNGAQFSGIYSCCMQKRTDHSTYPQGTMFVSDNYNGLIRIVSPGTLDSNGNLTSACTVSTLCGRNGTQFPTSAAAANGFAWMAVLSGMTTYIPTSISVVGGVTTVVLPHASPILANGWKVAIGTLDTTATADATFTGTISGFTLTVSGLTGTLGPGNPLTGAGLAANTCITSYGDAVGTFTSNVFQVNISQSVGPVSMSAWGSSNVGRPASSGQWLPIRTGPTTENGQGIYTLASFTDSQHFTITTPGISSIAAHTVVVIPTNDTYSSPNAINFSTATTSFPSMMRMSSKGHLVFAETWYNVLLRVAWLNSNDAPNASKVGTITRIGAFGNLAESGPSTNQIFGFFDIDDAITTTSSGVFTDPGIGACGPQDNMVLANVDNSALGSAGDADLWGFPGGPMSGFNYITTYDGSGFHGDGPPDLPSEGQGGLGHYPWGFTYSKTQFRMCSNGLDPTGFIQWRVGNGSDPSTYADVVLNPPSNSNLTRTPSLYNVYDQGGHIWAQGTRNIMPKAMRPSFNAIAGYTGVHMYGQGTGPSMDDLPGLYPTYAAIAAYVQAGMHGSVPRPELSIYDDTGTVPARPMKVLTAWMHRISMAGSWPTVDPPIFNTNIDDRTATGSLVTLGSYSLDFIRPNITVQVGDPIRVSNTSIRVRWTTDKATIGMVVAGTPNSNRVNNDNIVNPFSAYTDFTQDNSAVYGTTHDVTITGLPDITVIPPSGTNTPNTVAVFVLDRAGNWNVSTYYSIS